MCLLFTSRLQFWVLFHLIIYCSCDFSKAISVLRSFHSSFLAIARSSSDFHVHLLSVQIIAWYLATVFINYITSKFIHWLDCPLPLQNVLCSNLTPKFYKEDSCIFMLDDKKETRFDCFTFGIHSFLFYWILILCIIEYVGCWEEAYPQKQGYRLYNVILMAVFFISL